MSENGSGAEWTNSEALEAAIGELRETEEECPGVWYVSTYGGGEQDGREFYVVARDAETIPNEAKTYGTDIPGCPGYLLYPMDAERQTRKIIQYEILRYRTREGASDEDREALRETALDGMEECPEYFGAFPPPPMTPYGHTARYKTLINAAAMMNAIYRDFPEYAVQFNLTKQTGGGNPLGQALSGANRHASPDWMISLTPDAGMDFLRF